MKTALNSASVVSMAMLDLSTAHLAPSTRQLMQRGEYIQGALYYPKGTWGWFMCIPEVADAVEVAADIPQDLHKCIQFAQTLGQQWIQFDCDGTVVEGLETYEDEQTTNHAVTDQKTVLAQAAAKQLTRELGIDIRGYVSPAGKIVLTDSGSEAVRLEVTPEVAAASTYRSLPTLDIPFVPDSRVASATAVN